MTSGAVEEDEVNESSKVAEDFQTYLRNLVLFSAGSNALAWREIWSKWSYGELVEYSIQKMDRLNEDIRSVNDSDLEFAEQYNVTLLTKILTKL